MIEKPVLKPVIVCVGHILLDCFVSVSQAQLKNVATLCPDLDPKGIQNSPIHVSSEKMEGILRLLLGDDEPESERGPERCVNMAGVAGGGAKAGRLGRTEMVGRAARTAEGTQAATREGAIRVRAGGGAVNTAVAASILGMDARVLGGAGADKAGRELARLIRAAGPALDARVVQGAATGVFLKLAVQGGEGRAYTVVSPGAAHTIAGAPIIDAIPQNGILWIDGLLIDELLWLQDLANVAHQRGSLVAMDVSTLGNAVENADRLKDFAQHHADYVFANDAEFSALYPFGLSTAPSVISDFSRAPMQSSWIVKQGPAGALCICRDKTNRESHIFRQPTEPLTLEDSTGAGDFFSAGFLHGVICGNDPDQCLREGNDTAGELLLRCNSQL